MECLTKGSVVYVRSLPLGIQPFLHSVGCLSTGKSPMLFGVFRREKTLESCNDVVHLTEVVHVMTRCDLEVGSMHR